MHLSYHIITYLVVYYGLFVFEETLSTLEKNKKLDRLFEKHSRDEVIKNENGELISTKILKLEGELNDNFLLAMERIVKGLYYQEFKEVLIKNRVLSLFHPEGLHPNNTNEISRNFSSSSWHEVNNGTCRYVFIKMDLTDIVLFLELFNSIKLYYVIQVNRELESTAKHKT